MVLVQFAAFTSTVLPTGGSLPLRSELAAIGPGHVIDLLVGFTLVVRPALDDLDAIQVGADRITQGIDHEGGCISCL